jgi:hypothetical protein
MSEEILRRIRDPKYPSITASWLFLCDFELIEEDPPGWFDLASGEPYRIIARDAAGGRFCLSGAADGRPQRFLYVSSEGEAGTIASSLAEGMQLMIALPYWRDCLKFSGGGQVQEMHRAQAYFEKQLRREHDVRNRYVLYEQFDLTAPLSPLESLHRAIAEGTAIFVSPKDGTRFESLFNTFPAPE